MFLYFVFVLFMLCFRYLLFKAFNISLLVNQVRDMHARHYQQEADL